MVLLYSALLSWLKPAPFAFGLLYNRAPYPEEPLSPPLSARGSTAGTCPPGLAPKGSLPSLLAGLEH